jgi:malate dehydrogenase (oxaloacetate-decarboxylating)(NADP+)
MTNVYVSGLASTYPEPSNKEAFVSSGMYDYNYDACALPKVYPWPEF